MRGSLHCGGWACPLEVPPTTTTARRTFVLSRSPRVCPAVEEGIPLELKVGGEVQDIRSGDSVPVGLDGRSPEVFAKGGEGVSTGEIAYQEREQLPVPRRRGSAHGEVEAKPPPAQPEEETAGPLDRPTEAILVLAIVTPVMATYGAIAYGLYLAADAIF